MIGFSHSDSPFTSVYPLPVRCQICDRASRGLRGSANSRSECSIQKSEPRRSQGHDYPKTEKDEEVVRVVPVAGRTPRVTLIEVPGTPAQHAGAFRVLIIVAIIRAVGI